jgi:Autographiviridae endonuclease VII
MNKRILTDEQEAVLASEYVAGATCEALADKYGCSRGTVQNALRRQKVPRRTCGESSATRKVLTSNDEKVLVREYQEGVSLEALAAKFLCSPVTVRNTLIRLKVPRRSCGLRPSPVAPTKVCSSCGDDLPRKEFYGNGKRTSECKTCTSQKQGDKYDTDPEYRQRKRDWARRHKSGWSSGQFKAMWEVQKGCCAVCGIPMKRKGWASDAVCADHDHSTQQIRALLCSNCNRGLGCFKDSPHRLRQAAEYLEAHTEQLAETGT